VKVLPPIANEEEDLEKLPSSKLDFEKNEI
jgi:hypothetical protein